MWKILRRFALATSNAHFLDFHRGRYAAPAGRRPKPAADEPERFEIGDEDVTLRPPPKKKAREQKRNHNLMASVAQNKPSSKKH